MTLSWTCWDIILEREVPEHVHVCRVCNEPIKRCFEPCFFDDNGFCLAVDGTPIADFEEACDSCTWSPGPGTIWD